MSEFNMRVEERIAIWRREYVTVEAETLEEAIQKCIDGGYDIDDSEDLYETAERMDENEVQDSTFEIFQDDSDSLVYTNNPTTKCLQTILLSCVNI